MPSLIDIRRRIRSVKNTQQITKAMKMVAAAKLRRAQDRVIAARPYAAVLARALANVAAAAAGNERLAHPLLARRPEEHIQLIFLTSDRGLAGAFNANLIKGAQQFVAQRAGRDVRMEIVGRKGRDFFRKRRATISGEYIGVSEKPDYAEAKRIAGSVSERFASGEIDAVYLLYNEFKSVLSQHLTLERILPVTPPEGLVNVDYIYEQPPEELLNGLLPRYVEVQIEHALLESATAQHAARMTAMDAATSNAAEVIDKLTLYMNRVRQASITKEIIEVVSGAAAIE